MPNSIDLVTNWLLDIKKSHVSKEVETDDVDFKLCNKDQTVFYQYICDWIERKLVNPDEDPIYLILSGRAGCGKTFAVKCVKKYINEKCKAGFLKMAAPTGTAAFLIKGETLHSLFKLPVNKPFSEELTELQGETLKNFQNTFKDTELLIIDEMSMVGQYMLYQINRRLQEAKPHKSTTDFAGVSIVLMGDFAQLPPVTDKALFQAKGGTQFQSIGRCLYKDNFNKALTLKESMRQRGNDQTIFRNILDGIANGEFPDKDWENLVKYTSVMNSEEAKEEFKDAIKLCACNKDSKSFNIKKIRELNNPIAPIMAENSSPQAKKVSANKAGGLQNSILLSKGCKVMLLANLWSEYGLTNGAQGILRYIVYEKGKKPPELPAYALVYFPDYTGPSFLDKEEKLVPIKSETRKWFEPRSKKEVYRTMLPLVPAYAITIHKSQGKTLDKIILNIGDTEFAAGLTYTALSRTTDIKKIAFDWPFPKIPRFRSIFRSKLFTDRRNEEKRLAKLSI